VTRLRLAVVLASLPPVTFASMLFIDAVSVDLLVAVVIPLALAGLVFAVAAVVASAFAYRGHGRLRPSLLMALSLVEVLFMGQLTLALRSASRGFF
jgi:hypothetical protein